MPGVYYIRSAGMDYHVHTQPIDFMLNSAGGGAPPGLWLQPQRHIAEIDPASIN